MISHREEKEESQLLGLRSAAKKILAMCRFTVINAKVVFEVELEGEIGEDVISGERSSKTVEQLQVAPCLSASLASCLRLRVATSRYPPPCRLPVLSPCKAATAIPLQARQQCWDPRGCSKLCITAPHILNL